MIGDTHCRRAYWNLSNRCGGSNFKDNNDLIEGVEIVTKEEEISPAAAAVDERHADEGRNERYMNIQ